MKKLIRVVIFIFLSLAVHIIVISLVDTSKTAKPNYVPMEITLVRNNVPEKKLAPEKPPEIPVPVQKPVPGPEPLKDIVENPHEPEGLPEEEPQPVEEQVAYIPEAVEHESMAENYHQTVIEIIRKNLYYPGSARRRGIEGTVQIRLVLDASGSVSEINVVKTSGYSLLDRASVKTIKSCIFPPPPDESLTLSIPITFKLVEDS